MIVIFLYQLLLNLTTVPVEQKSLDFNSKTTLLNIKMVSLLTSMLPIG